jgi:hypothetical protein
MKKKGGKSKRNEYELKIDREKHGRCATCGIQTHKELHEGIFVVRTILVPITNDTVLRGRCLECNPLNSTGGRKLREVNSSIEDADSINPNGNIVVQVQDYSHGIAASSQVARTQPNSKCLSALLEKKLHLLCLLLVFLIVVVIAVTALYAGSQHQPRETTTTTATTTVVIDTSDEVSIIVGGQNLYFDIMLG